MKCQVWEERAQIEIQRHPFNHRVMYCCLEHCQGVRTGASAYSCVYHKKREEPLMEPHIHLIFAPNLNETFSLLAF